MMHDAPGLLHSHDLHSHNHSGTLMALHTCLGIASASAADQPRLDLTVAGT